MEGCWALKRQVFPEHSSQVSQLPVSLGVVKRVADRSHPGQANLPRPNPHRLTRPHVTCAGLLRDLSLALAAGDPVVLSKADEIAQIFAAWGQHGLSGRTATTGQEQHFATSSWQKPK